MKAAELARIRADVDYHHNELGKLAAKRDRLIVEARAEGLALRAIAEAAGLSHTAVAKILERTK